MSLDDTLKIIAVGAIAVAAVYLLATRRRPASSRGPARAVDGENGDAEAAEEEAASSDDSLELPSRPLPAASSVPPEDVLTALYEEDEDVDPTKVGEAVSGALAPQEVPVQKIVYDEDAATDEPTQPGALFLVHATAQTDTGKRRKRNEDSLLVMEEEGLFVVADGMGGYRGGELASQLAVKTIGDTFKQKSFEGTPSVNLPREATELARAMQRANNAILGVASKRKEYKGMGTTVCAARFLMKKRRLYLGHVGDSRCYRLREGVLSQMTVDHTMADFGVTGPESAYLSRAVGIWPTVPIDVLMASPQVQDVYLLCSDGLTKMLPDGIIGTVLRAEEDPKAAVERLIFFANARGGKDNITVILVRVVPPNWVPRPSTLDPNEIELPPPSSDGPPFSSGGGQNL